MRISPLLGSTRPVAEAAQVSAVFAAGAALCGSGFAWDADCAQPLDQPNATVLDFRRQVVREVGRLAQVVAPPVVARVVRLLRVDLRREDLPADHGDPTGAMATGRLAPSGRQGPP